METTQLIKSLSIENLITQRDNIIKIATQVIELLKQADIIGKQFKKDQYQPLFDIREFQFHTSLEHYPIRLLEDNAIEKIQKEYDRHAWGYLMDKSGILDLMDKQAKDAWYKETMQGKFPTLNLENVEATFNSLYNDRQGMFERGILNIFKALTWDYKTNEPSKFGKKIIIDYIFDSKYGSFSYGHRIDSIDDLDRALHILDSKPEPDYKTKATSLIKDASREDKQETETPYFYAKWYLKGSCHLTFKRMDLIEKMNKILSKHYPHAISKAA